MFVGITNTPRDYAWGSTTAIAELLGREPSGRPEAELWLGTHPGSPSTTEHGTLDEVAELPFLLKVLAADAPLSLQAHPTLEQAIEGFSRENAAGIALDAPNRSYRDASDKPELIYALSDPFEALCGFRSVSGTRELLAPLSGDPAVAMFLDRLVDDASLKPVFEWLLSRGDGVQALTDALLKHDDSRREWETVRLLASKYPGDPGVAISLLLNSVSLRPGEVIYLPAGNIHAYLHGLGIELMTSSDNVLRGGLTPKHIDVPELLKVVDFRPLPVPYLEPEHPAPGVSVFSPGARTFTLVALDGAVADFAWPLTGKAIALCARGEFRLEGSVSSTVLGRGDSSYITPDEGRVTFAGEGMLFLATGEDSAP
jgi:mannose-6-phosphate isomerase